MSDALDKAAKDAVEAASNTEQLALIAALLKAQQITQQVQQPAPHPPVQQPSGGTGKWLAIGIGGSFLAVSLAISAVAVAVSAVALTACLLVLRSLLRDYQKGR